VKDDGTVKVLDFGLAKALAPDTGVAADVANSPTLTAPATQIGMILGTPAYMSPEQVRGKAVDRRADVWAFGVVLYEMLTGRRAFARHEVSDVLASVLNDSVPLETLPSDTPVSIRRLLRRCLEKDRANRLDSMVAVRLEIADAMSPGDDDATRISATAAPGASKWRTSVAMIGVGLAAAAIALAAGWMLFRSPTTGANAERTVRVSIPLPTGVSTTQVAVTSNDNTVIYQAGRVYARGLADSEARPLAGTEGASNLSVSPDGRWLAFSQGNYIKKVAVAGGDPLTIVETAFESPGGGWGPNNTIIFTRGWNLPLLSVSADGGGKPVPLTTIDTAAGEQGHWWPELLPDGKTVLFTVWMAAAGINDARIAALDIATGKHRIIMQGAFAKYIAPGQLLYFFAGGYHIVGFDPVALRRTGEPRNVLPDAQPLDPIGSSARPVAVSADGTLAYLAGALNPEGQLAWLTPAGAVELINVPSQRYTRLDLSPDGRRVAYSRDASGRYELWLTDLVRLTDEKMDAPGLSYNPVWSPKGDFLAFTSMRAGDEDVATIRPGERAKIVIAAPADQWPGAISTDGKFAVINEYFGDGTVSPSVVPLDRPQDRKRLAIDSATSRTMSLSPDDRWIAINVIKFGRSQVIVCPLQETGPVVQASSQGGTTPRFSRKSSILYYVNNDQLVAATYSTAGGIFSIVREETIARPGPFRLGGVAPDGRFLIAKMRPAEPQVHVVVNWPATVNLK
jgi:serine/threonine-protein kinase